MTKLVSHSEVLNQYIGQPGSPERENFEAELRADVLAAKIKEMRLKRNMTQEELGSLIGRDKSQISKIESGRNLTLSTIIEVVKALGGKISFEIKYA